MTRPRDNQRSRMYAAEWECFGWPKMEFKNMEQLEEYLWEVLSNRHVQNKYETARSLVDGNIPLKVSNGAGARRAWARKNPELYWVSFPRLSRTKHIVIHEVAHLLTPAGVQSHGREFCQNYLYLVRIMMGADKEKQFKAAMKKHKCKYSKRHSPYKEPLTQEQKDAMLARLLKNKS